MRTFENGQTVRIMAGFYQGFQAIVENYDEEKANYKVWVIDAKQAATVPAKDVRPPNKP
jgi:transcription antitermination factor NusG